MRIVVNDANILIDLVKLKLLSHFFALELKFYTTDLILNELHEWQIEEYKHFINMNKLAIIELSEIELIEIQHLRNEKRQLSEQDCSAIICTKKLDGSLITSDKILRNFAVSKNMVVVGHLWIFDKMIEEETITPLLAINKLTELRELVNPRLNLPKSECESRIEKWKHLSIV